MSKNGPIILIDDDPDDIQIAKEAIDELQIHNRFIPFTSAIEAFEYLANSTAEQPFVILSDINLPKMSGIKLKKAIDNNEALRKKSIPFIYYSTSGDHTMVNAAFEMQVQGFFVKKHSMQEITSC